MCVSERPVELFPTISESNLILELPVQVCLRTFFELSETCCLSEQGKEAVRETPCMTWLSLACSLTSSVRIKRAWKLQKGYRQTAAEAAL